MAFPSMMLCAKFKWNLHFDNIVNVLSKFHYFLSLETHEGVTPFIDKIKLVPLV